MEGKAVIPAAYEFEVTFMSGLKIYVDIEFALLDSHNSSSFVCKGNTAYVETCFWNLFTRNCEVRFVEYSTNVNKQLILMTT